MTPYHLICPEPGWREIRCLHALAPGAPLPVGEYAFMECYCEDLDCDCRRVLIQVYARADQSAPLATINYGWESVGFYTRWMHGDAQAGSEIVSASLDPLHPQSRYADHLLDYFQQHMLTAPEYVARLRAHYDQFKRALTRGPDVPAESAAAELSSPSPGPADLSPGISMPLVQSTPVLFTTTADILRQLQRVPEEADFAPYEAALRAAIEQREAIVPELIAALDRVSADPGHYLKHHDECLHLFALLLLAQFRETRALDAFIRFLSMPEEAALDLSGDMFTEQGAALLASVCGGDPAPLLRLAHDESVNELIRDVAIDGLLLQAGWGERPHPALIEDLRRLFETLPKPGNGFVWACLVGLVGSYVPELAAEARQAFADKRVDTSLVDLAFFENALAGTEPHGGRDRAGRFKDFLERNAPIDAVAECSSWTCFRRDEDDLLVGEAPEEEGFSAEDRLYDPAPNSPQRTWTRPTPYVAPPKVGRNEPCPCGSGRKYKRCCGAT